jgi:hypothetical protein
MTAPGGEQRPIKPVYLSGTLTVVAELSAGCLFSSRWSSPAGRRRCSRKTSAASSQGSAFPDPGSCALPTTPRASSPGRGSQASRHGDRAGPVRQVPPRAWPGGAATGVTSPGHTAESSRELPADGVVAVAGWLDICRRGERAPSTTPVPGPIPDPVSGEPGGSFPSPGCRHGSPGPLTCQEDIHATRNNGDLRHAPAGRA